jgi:chromosome segregation ATPase
MVLEDQHQWDTRLRHLAALCRYGETAPVSFYGLRRVCGLAPMEREDYDIVRVEVRQLVEAMDSVVQRLNETDQRMLASKRLEQNQVRSLASTYTAVRDELEYKESTLAVVTQTNADLATALDDETTEKLKAVAARDDARAVVNSNQRIYKAMESEAINYQYDSAMRSNCVIESQMKELIEYQRSVARLRNQLSDQQADTDAQVAKLRSELATAESEKAALASTLEDARAAAAAAATAAEQALAESQSRCSAAEASLAEKTSELEAALAAATTDRKAAAQAAEAAEARRLAEESDWKAQLNTTKQALAAESDQVVKLRSELRSSQSDLDDMAADKEYLTNQLLDAKEKYDALERLQLKEKRSMTSDKLSLKSEMKDLKLELEAAEEARKLACQEKLEAVAAMQAQIDAIEVQLGQANAVALQAKKDMDKEVTKRTNAYVTVQAEASLRLATEESKVFDKVPKYIADKAQEEKDLHRFLDAATYRLSEVNYVQKEILGTEFVEQAAIEGAVE